MKYNKYLVEKKIMALGITVMKKAIEINNQPKCFGAENMKI